MDPVSSNYRGWDVWEIPPNGQGIAALQIPNIMEHFDVGSLEANSTQHLHLFIEAKKLAFEDRANYYADPDFAEVPTEWLISKESVRRKRSPKPDGEGANITFDGAHLKPGRFGTTPAWITIVRWLLPITWVFEVEPAHRTRSLISRLVQV